MPQSPESVDGGPQLSSRAVVARRSLWQEGCLLAALAVLIGTTYFILINGPERLAERLRSRNEPDAKVFAELLKLKNGDSVDRVYGMFPSATVNTDVVGIYQLDAAKNPARYPDGVRADDVFLECCCVQPGFVYLQVRNGRLINYSPDNYRDILDYR